MEETSTRRQPAERTGILLANLGTPEAPTPEALRRFLGEFLWDRRVVDLPRPLWWLVLNGIILRTRPRLSARLYGRIWTEEGSPLLVIARHQTAALAAELRRRLGAGAPTLALGMRYGEPAIRRGLETLRQAECRRILILPLYPQYSAPTVGSTFDAVAEVLKAWRWVPELRLVTHYHEEPGYIRALAASVRETWAAGGGQPDRLLFSFHGLPERYARAGDPYPEQCHQTARRVAEELGLRQGQWGMSYQSRFGREEWLRPYTDQTLRRWAEEGVGRVDVICPGFSADCLETLEEIALTGRELFLRAGGSQYRYIPALNERADHIAMLADLVQRQMRGWE